MDEDQTASAVSLEILPRNIGDAHRRLCQVIERLCVLEDFLLGSQVREHAPERKKEPEIGVVNHCFENLGQVVVSIEECYKQLGVIIKRLGVPNIKEKGMPEIEEVSDV